MIVFCFSIICCIICGLICDAKGRTVWKGLIAGFFLGWIGIVICAFLDNHEK